MAVTWTLEVISDTAC